VIKGDIIDYNGVIYIVDYMFGDKSKPLSPQNNKGWLDKGWESIGVITGNINNIKIKLEKEQIT